MVKNKAPKQKHIPMRTCIATGVKKPKSQLIRLVKLEVSNLPNDFLVKVDPKGKGRGRGANLEMDIEAFDLAIKKGAIERALRLERKLTGEEILQLRKDFLNAIEERNFRKGKRKVTLKISKEEMEEKLA